MHVLIVNDRNHAIIPRTASAFILTDMCQAMLAPRSNGIPTKSRKARSSTASTPNQRYRMWRLARSTEKLERHSFSLDHSVAPWIDSLKLSVVSGCVNGRDPPRRCSPACAVSCHRPPAAHRTWHWTCVNVLVLVNQESGRSTVAFSLPHPRSRLWTLRLGTFAFRGKHAIC